MVARAKSRWTPSIITSPGGFDPPKIRPKARAAAKLIRKGGATRTMSEKTPRPELPIGGVGRAGLEKLSRAVSDLQTNPIAERQQVPVPRVRTRFVVCERVVQTFVLCCPYCGRSHWHGGSAAFSGDPRDAFSAGPIIAHCHEGGLYILAPSEEPAIYYSSKSRTAKARAAMNRLQTLGIETSDDVLIKPRYRRRAPIRLPRRRRW
jgi:hypothetical protein